MRSYLSIILLCFALGFSGAAYAQEEEAPAQGTSGETPEWTISPIVVMGKGTGWGGGFQYTHQDVLGPDTFFRNTSLFTQHKDKAVSFQGQWNNIYDLTFISITGSYSLYHANTFFGFGNNTNRDHLVYFLEERWFLDVDTGFHIGPVAKAGLGYHFESNRLGPAPSERDIDSVESRFGNFPALNERTKFHLVKFFIEYDSRDDKFHPTSGVKARAEYINSRLLKKSNYKFHSWLYDLVYLYPLFPNELTIALRGQYGITVGDNHLPIFHRFAQGGFHSLRAHPGRRYVDYKKILFNCELRYYVFENGRAGWFRRVEASAFVDIGRVYARQDEPFTLKGMHPSFGGGIRIGVGLSTLRADMATNFAGDTSLGIGFGYPF